MESVASSASLMQSQEHGNSNSSLVSGGFIDPKTMMHNWLFECHGFWHNALLMTSSLLFVLYLVSQARKSLSKLSHGGRSYIIIAYYASLWLVSLLNLAWCCLQVGFIHSLKLFEPSYVQIVTLYVVGWSCITYWLLCLMYKLL